MTIISQKKVVPYTPEQMFTLVQDVPAYPEFVPCCKEARILERTQDEQTAMLRFAKGALQKSFTTKNRAQENKMIEMKLVTGPFKHLHGFWRFELLENGQCQVSFDMEFEIAGRLLSTVFGPLFNQITNRLVDAFCQRAETVYGKQKK